MLITLSRILITISLLLSGTQTWATPLESFDLQFDVTRNGKPLGKAKLSLRPLREDQWEFLSHTEGTKGLARLVGISIQERSVFRWQDERLQALSYQFDQDMAFKSKYRSFRVHPETKLISGADDNGKFNLPYTANVLDRNLVVLALALDLRANKKRLTYRIVDKRKVDIQRYTIAGIETISTAKGKIEAIRVERIRKQAGRSTTTWIAPSLGYLPVQIRQTEPNGETIEMTLR